jgi:hypothetical protein
MDTKNNLPQQINYIISRFHSDANWMSTEWIGARIPFNRIMHGGNSWLFCNTLFGK